MANIVKYLPILLVLFTTATFYSRENLPETGEDRIICNAENLYSDELIPAGHNSQSDKNLLNEIFRSATTFCRNESGTDSGSFREFLSHETTGYPLYIEKIFFRTTEHFNIFLQEIDISEEGYRFDSINGKPGRIFILCISPQDDAAPHIECLAAIGTLLANKNNVEKILTCNSAEKIYNIFKG